MKQKILIIDDDRDFVSALHIFLESRGFEVAFAHNAEQGFEKIRESAPDLILLDNMMENQAQGMIFSRKLARDPALPKIPILMLTGMREQTGFFFPGSVEHPYFLPVNELVEKPVDLDTLQKKIEKVLADVKQGRK